MVFKCWRPLIISHWVLSSNFIGWDNTSSWTKQSELSNWYNPDVSDQKKSEHKTIFGFQNPWHIGGTCLTNTMGIKSVCHWTFGLPLPLRRSWISQVQKISQVLPSKQQHFVFPKFTLLFLLLFWHVFVYFVFFFSESSIESLFSSYYFVFFLPTCCSFSVVFLDCIFDCFFRFFSESALLWANHKLRIVPRNSCNVVNRNRLKLKWLAYHFLHICFAILGVVRIFSKKK
jgi:hypothetical protein